MAYSRDYMACINKADEIGARLSAPDVLAPESVEVARVLSAVRVTTCGHARHSPMPVMPWLPTGRTTRWWARPMPC